MATEYFNLLPAATRKTLNKVSISVCKSLEFTHLSPFDDITD